MHGQGGFPEIGVKKTDDENTVFQEAPRLESVEKNASRDQDENTMPRLGSYKQKKSLNKAVSLVRRSTHDLDESLGSNDAAVKQQDHEGPPKAASIKREYSR